ncbi:MAG: hypothetical protein ACD_45C00589G0001 [uncultured bacterium]|nr:MAG: hypothetical protein ACD_45C00589G0001 [uncultured bacterium]
MSQTRIPEKQRWLISSMKALGYAAEERGVCFGVAHMGLQALLVGEISQFDRRLELIARIPPENLVKEINTVKIKAQEKKTLKIIRNSVNPEKKQPISY